MRVLRILALPISLVYAVVVHLRNWLFDIGFFSSTQFLTPTIAIGNLSTGGTGKTPMVSVLVELLGKDYKLAMLSRGYGRKSKGFRLADENMTAIDIGDEPLQLHSKHPSLIVAVDVDRCNGIRKLEDKKSPDIIILDDAFQHRKVLPHLSLLLTSYESLYIDDWYLPTGNLRDAKNQAKRANIIIVTKCPKNLSTDKKQRIRNSLNPKSHQEVIFGTLKYGDFLQGEKDKIQLQAIQGKEVALVTGIADPKPLVDYLKDNGVDFKHFNFADHHFFSDKEIFEFNHYEVVLTTEKDYARLKERLPKAYFLEVKHSFSKDDTNILKERIGTLMKLRPEV